MVPLSLDERRQIQATPFRFTASGHLNASAAGVFIELADPSRWFPLITSCLWHGRVGGVGSVREVHVRLFGTFRETMIAWEPAGPGGTARVAFTMTETTSPLVSCMAEDFAITPALGGVRLDWTLAAVTTALGRLAAPALRQTLRRMFAVYRPRLERLAASAPVARPSTEPARGTPAS
ncbi:MAG TPA: SRPBCC family protein [Kofleriaceae bacterium]